MKLEELQIEYKQRGLSRLIRGGSWVSPPQSVACARRYNFTPDSRSHFYISVARHKNLGFRIVRNR
jgi:formylglycine-generating enzyme required for sulfatase activity